MGMSISAPAHACSTENEVARDLTGFETPQEALPLWEVGLAAGAGSTIDYPASSESNALALVLPYVIYRGDIVRVSGGEAQAVVKETDRWQFDLSLGGAFAADSDENTVREGMPELDFLFEAGPQATYLMIDKAFAKGGVGRLKGSLQARSVFSTDFGSLNHVGYVFEPELVWQQRGRLYPHSALTVRFTPTFASRGVHAFFYSVPQRYATAIRPTYSAAGGYLGTKISMGVSFELADNVRAYIGGTMSLHHGSANETSPLFEDKITYMYGAGVVWRLYTSERQASF
jgi:outer membrane scaffolding protein for murein synthesis (MipA/OmpV family)